MTKALESLPNADAALIDGIDRGFHFGGQVYVSLLGEVVVDDALGRGAPDGSELTGDEWVIWLSASKPVGAIAVAQLWEAGKLDLDAPVTEIIPEFGAGGKDAITMRQILTHTAGFRPMGFPDVGIPWDEIIARICASPLEVDWVIGETAGYHERSSWFILAEAIRRIDGRAFPDYVRDEIFAPLGMNDSWIGMSTDVYDANAGRITAIFNTGRGAVEELSWHRKDECVACRPGSNGRGPIRELGWFYEALANDGQRDGARILKPNTVAEWTRTHRAGKFDKTFQHRMDWALGFIVDSKHHGAQTAPYSFGTRCSPRTFGHGGMQSVSSFCDPEHGLVVAVALNGLPGEPQHNKRIREFATAIYTDLGF